MSTSLPADATADDLIDRALSVQQPWAWLLVTGRKGIENRTWTTRFRGRIWIHAGKQWDADGADWIQSRFGLVIPTDLPRGAIVGSLVIADCVTTSTSPWFFGPVGFVCQQPRQLATPVRRPGKLGLFRVPASEMSHAA